MIRWRSLGRGAVLVAALALWADGVAAQVRHEVQVATTVTTADPAALTAGPGAAIRIGRRDRLAGSLGFGAAGGAFATRGEVLYHFLLSPSGTGAGVYLGGGVAAEHAGEWRGWLVGLVGIETAAGGRRGWFAEAGFGGGFRAAAGVRWRWQ